VQIHEDTGRSKGWALVSFATPEQANFACIQFNLQEFQGRQMSVRLDRTPLEGAPGCLVYVGNLSWSCTDEDLYEVFASFAPADARVERRSNDGKSRGFGILRFIDPQQAASAIGQLNGFLFQERELVVREEVPVERRKPRMNEKPRREAPAKAAGQSGVAKGNNVEISASDTLYVNNLSWNR
jgi:RNA recognition motif-containing protein